MFAFRLALALGRTVSELDSSMTSAEFTEWMAYYAIEPFGQWRDNWHFAQLTALMFNVNCGKSSQLSTADFMYLDAAADQEKKDLEFVAKLNSLGTKKPNGR